jgi:hypothetical protein
MESVNITVERMRAKIVEAVNAEGYLPVFKDGDDGSDRSTKVHTALTPLFEGTLTVDMFRVSNLGEMKGKLGGVR